MTPPHRLADSLRLAAAVVAEVIGGHNLNQALAACWARRNGPVGAARAAVMDLSYTALRSYGRGDFLLARLIPRPLQSAEVRALLLLALARLEARAADAHVTVDQAVEAAAGMAGGRFKGLVNGVLRSFLRQREDLEAAAGRDEAARWQHPAWWLARLRADHPQRWQDIAAIGNGHPPMALRVNRRRLAACGLPRATRRRRRCGESARRGRRAAGEAAAGGATARVLRRPGFGAGPGRAAGGAAARRARRACACSMPAPLPAARRRTCWNWPIST
ncbi:MAG: hypothetical protein MZW92_76165 [Comamonadaceae bacterium]|nr:hypothetical protein [Comamonadaceae bacterium]